MLTNLPYLHLLPKNIKYLQGSECQLYIIIEVSETISRRLQQTQNMTEPRILLSSRHPPGHHIEVHLTVDFRRIVEGDETTHY